MILHQIPAVHELAGIVIVVGANVVAVSTLHSTREEYVMTEIRSVRTR